MDTSSLLSIVKLAAGFAVVIGFGIYQLRSLDKLDREEQEKAAKED